MPSKCKALSSNPSKGDVKGGKKKLHSLEIIRNKEEKNLKIQQYIQKRRKIYLFLIY
jgi:hypothetical protein